jgi:23S rRNA pseudouridine2605 synthase
MATKKSGQYKKDQKPKAKANAGAKKSAKAKGKGLQGKFNQQKKKTAAPTSNDNRTRLNKYLAHAGIASRREADKLIKAGLVQINDKVVTEMGYKVEPDDVVKFNGSVLQQEKKVYYALNKPKGFITTVSDPKARKTVMELMAGAGKERIYPVGRLDRKTTGVLLFTNDGDLAKKLMHPAHGARKIYQVVLDKNLEKKDLVAIEDGLELSDGPIKVDEISYIENKSRKNVGVILHSGRNRIVRRIFEHLEYEVTQLDRVFFAGITKKNLSRGQWRKLSDKEVSFLKMH